MKMIDLEVADRAVEEDIKKAMDRVISHGLFINGPEVKIFEEELSAYLGGSHVVACGNGSDALVIAFQALDLPIGSEVIMPSFNYVASAEAAIVAGLRPVFADVDSDDFGLSPEAVRPLINQQTSAIVAVHLFGQACQINSLKSLADEFDLKLIEDNAQSLGAEVRIDGVNKKLSTIGHIATNSFFPTKNLGCYGDGGCLVTMDQELALKCRELAKHGQTKKYFYEAIGRNSRLDTLQAALLSVKLQKLDEHIELRRQNAAYYANHLGSIEDVILPSETEGSYHSYNQYTIRVKAERRTALRDFLSERSIPSIIYYPHPLHTTPAYAECQKDAMTHTERLSQEVLSLPVYPNIGEADLSTVTQAIKAFFEA